jgi:hypothetical protein
MGVPDSPEPCFSERPDPLIGVGGSGGEGLPAELQERADEAAALVTSWLRGELGRRGMSEEEASRFEVVWDPTPVWKAD